MIRLASKNLETSVQKRLDHLQKRVDDEGDFSKKARKASTLWKSKGGKKGKEAFIEIRKQLSKMTVFKDVCNYCEQSEANDIEHIDPKSFFPNKAFVWENYLLACKQCNSGLKLDKCHVLDANDELIEVKRGNPPPNQNIAFINPRNEDTGDFMILSLSTFKFQLLPGVSKRDGNRVKSTLDILELNNRDILLAARKSTAQHYYEKLERLVRILNTTNKTQLKALLNPYDDLFDLSKSLSELKKEIRESHRLYISTYLHPSVWHSIKVIESKVNNKWKALFVQFPEALNW